MKKKLLLFAMSILGIMPIYSKNEKQPAYVYGFATSFNDSTVYITDIQMVEDAWIDSKTKFLYGRDSYSYQLRDYLKANGMTAPTCITVFATTRKKAEEKYLKLRNKYIAKGRYSVKYLGENDFKYSPVAFDESVVYVDSSTSQPEPKAKAKKKDKKAQKNK